MLCIDPWDEQQEFHPFNYAVRRIWAALIASVPDVEVELIEGSGADVDDFCARLEAFDPDVIGASAYTWSFPSFVRVAEQHKARRPEATIVFGGPSARPAMFALPPYFGRRFAVDALVLGEGERTFASVVELARRDAASLASIPGLALPSADGFRTTGPAPLVERLDDLPSPYALDLVTGPVSAHLETFRGCPLSCTFCQWGEADGNRWFSREYLVRELLHMKRLGLRQALLVDAGLNLHSRAFKALAAAERETRVLREIGLHFEIYPSRITDQELQFLQEIKLHGIGVGLQSYDKEVLRRLERPFDEGRFESAVRTLAGLGGDVIVEIILGLPGDTPESFFRTLDRARRLPCDVRVYHCLVLPDALMTRAPSWADLRYDPGSLKMLSCAGWSEAALARATEKLTRLTEEAEGWNHGLFWFFPQERRRGVSGPNARLSPEIAPRSAPAALSTGGLEGGREEGEVPVEVLAGEAVQRVAGLVREATRGALIIDAIERRLGVILLRGRCGETALTVELEPRERAPAAFRLSGDVAVSHSGVEELSPGAIRALHLLAHRCGPLLHRLVFGEAPKAPPRALPVI